MATLARTTFMKLHQTPVLTTLYDQNLRRMMVTPARFAQYFCGFMAIPHNFALYAGATNLDTVLSWQYGDRLRKPARVQGCRTYRGRKPVVPAHMRLIALPIRLGSISVALSNLRYSARHNRRAHHTMPLHRVGLSVIRRGGECINYGVIGARFSCEGSTK